MSSIPRVRILFAGQPSLVQASLLRWPRIQIGPTPNATDDGYFEGVVAKNNGYFATIKTCDATTNTVNIAARQ